jgi:ABC-type sugar transport system ATPase subunit
VSYLELRGLEKRFGEVRAVADLDLNVSEGEFFSLLGPSGCGKTTTMRMIAGLETPTEGSVTLAGREVTRLDPADRDVAMVFQDYALYPHMSVQENVAYPLRVRNVKLEARRERALEVARSLRIETLLERRPSQLSGGQQQRAAVARAVVHRSKLLLMDEPLSNLDAQLRFEARTFLKRLQRELGLSVLYVTHDQLEAMALSDRMAIMRDGRVQQVGAPLEVYRRPANAFVASFVGQPPMNLIRLEQGALEGPLGEVVGRAMPSGAHTLGVRPEDVRVSAEPGPNRVPAEVVNLEPLGAETLVTLEALTTTGGAAITARVFGAEPPELPRLAHLEFDRTRLHFFGEDGARLS